jgi:hypothetical protein
MVSFATIGSVDTTWARLVSWFPLTAPLAMPNRIAMGAATWWDPIVASALTLAAVAGLVVLGGRVYTRAILHTGATLSLSEAWRGAPTTLTEDTAKPGTDSTTEVSSTGLEATRRESRAQIVAIIVGLVFGAAVFILTHDFVLGVGSGAAVYALAVRITRWRAGRSGGHAPGSPDHNRKPVIR